MPAPHSASDSPRDEALVLRLLQALPAEGEPRRTLRTLLGHLREELGSPGIALEVPDRLDPSRHVQLVAEGEEVPPESNTPTTPPIVTWSLDVGGTPLARLRLLDPDRRLTGLDARLLKALLTHQVQSGLRGLDLEQRSLFARCAEHLVGRLAGGATEPELYGSLVQSLTEILPIDRAAVFTLSEDRNSLIPWAVSDRRDALPGGTASIPDPVVDLRAEPRLGDLLRGGRVVIVEDIESAPLPEEWRRLAAGRRVRSILAFPLTAGRGAWGLVVLCRELPGPVLSPLDTELARLLMQHLAPLLQNSRVMEQLQASVSAFRTLLEAGREISAVLDPWEIPRRVAIKGVELTGADECLVTLLDSDRRTLRPVIALGRSEERLLRHEATVGTGLMGEAAAARRTTCRNGATMAELEGIGFARPGALLAVPLVCAEELLGVMLLFRAGTREFSDLEIMVATVFGTQGAISLDNARLFQSEATERTRLATMIEQLEDGVVVCDAQGVIQRVNPSGRRWLGEVPDPEGEILSELLRRQRRTDLAEELAGLGTGDVRHLTREIAFAGRVDLVGATAIQSVDGPFAGVVLLIRDVTAIRTLERQLMQAGKMSAVGQLASGVAHEFNNLIAAIYGYAQLMRDSSDPKIQRKGIDIILGSSERARRLTQNLLTLSRDRRDQDEAVDLNALVENTLQLVEAQWRAEGIEIVRQFESLPTTWLQPGPLSDALLNLLTNARHAIQEASPGEGVIRLATLHLGGEIELRVVDNGVGIPPADLPRLFDPFFTTKGPLGGRATPGMGLGLFTVYNIVNGLGGRIEVESLPGRGATFRVRLPIRAERPMPHAA